MTVLRDPLTLFGALALIVVAAAGYSRGARDLALPATLQYLPKESELFVAAGDIESLWGGVDRNFGTSIREEPPMGTLGSMVAELAKNLAEQKLPLRDPRQLAEYGIDPHGGVLLAADGLDRDSSLVAVLRVSDQRKFETALATALELPVRDEPVSIGADVRVVAFGESNAEYWVAFPEPDVAVVANQLSFLRRSLEGRRANLAYLRADDGLYDAVRRRRHWRMLVGPEALFSWRPRQSVLVTRATGVLTLHEDGVRLAADVELASSGVRSLDDIFIPGRFAGAWAQQAGAEAALTLAFRHPNASRFLPLIAAVLGGDPAAMGERQGIFGQLATISDIRQIALALPRYREGLPDVLLGVWADPARMRTLIGNLQRELHAARDERILIAAVTEYCAPRDKESCRPSVENLYRAGLLSPEPHRRFEHYRMERGAVRPAGGSAPALEDARVYREKWPLTRLSPPITLNDVRYRPELADADPTTLKSDRYRLVATEANGILWIATEEHDLTTLLDRGEAARDSLAASRLYRAASGTWSPNASLQFYVNTDRTTMIALRSREKAVVDAAQMYLRDFRSHPVITLELVPVARGRRLRIEGHALLWSALSGQ